MDRFELMNIFIAVAETTSLSAGGRSLNLPLATVSRKIAELESHLGVRLLNRSTRSMELTEEGKNYLIACKKIIEDVSEAEKMVSGEYSIPRGDLIVTAPLVFGRIHLLPLVSKFLKAYPEINVRLVLTDRVTNLLEEHIDLAIRIGELPDSSLIGKHLGHVRKVTCAGPAYLASRKIPKSLDELSSHDCIVNESLDSNIWTFYSGTKKTAIKVHPRLSTTTSEAALGAAISGVGITRVLSYQAKEAITKEQLKIVLEKYEPPQIPVHLISLSNYALPLKLLSFRDFIVPTLRRQLS